MWHIPLRNNEDNVLYRLKLIVLQTHLREGDDRPIWMPVEGDFTTTKCCKLLHGTTTPNSPPNLIWKAVWESKVSPKINIFCGRSKEEY